MRSLFRYSGLQPPPPRDASSSAGLSWQQCCSCLKRLSPGVHGRALPPSSRCRLQPVTQLIGLACQPLDLPEPIRLLIRCHLLTHVLLAVLQQPIDAHCNLPRRCDHRLRSAGTGLNAPIEGAQGILGVMTALGGQPESPRRSVLTTPNTPAFDLPRRATMLRTQAQPTDKVLLRMPLAHVDADLAQYRQGRALVDTLDHRQVHTTEAVQRIPYPKSRVVGLAFALARP